jgi:hypothetical protein
MVSSGVNDRCHPEGATGPIARAERRCDTSRVTTTYCLRPGAPVAGTRLASGRLVYNPLSPPMRILRTALAAAVLISLGAAADAQAPRRAQARDGFWIGFGLGASNNDLECTGCAFTGPSDPWHGGFGSHGFLAMGGALSQQLLLGGELGSATVIGNGRDATVGQLLFIARYYPGAFEGFHVDGGMGPAVYMLEGGGGSVEATGFAVRVGAGYDFALGRRFAITPYANVARTMVQQGSISATGTAGPVTRLQNTFVTQFGIGFHWY